MTCQDGPFNIKFAGQKIRSDKRKMFYAKSYHALINTLQMFMKGYHKITALNCSSYNLVVEVRPAGPLGAHGFLKNKKRRGFCFYILRIYGTACIASKPESS